MVEGIQKAPTLSMLTSQNEPATTTPHIEVPIAPVVAQPFITLGSMPLLESKMLRVFLKLSPPRFSGYIVEDNHVFLTTCLE